MKHKEILADKDMGGIFICWREPEDDKFFAIPNPSIELCKTAEQCHCKYSGIVGDDGKPDELYNEFLRDLTPLDENEIPDLKGEWWFIHTGAPF